MLNAHLCDMNVFYDNSAGYLLSTTIYLYALFVANVSNIYYIACAVQQ